ncbi:MAG: peptidylprolyl isomerase [Chitinophagaceae bacterium]|nr:peptidylprolyl isomerase [Chitinophagaceae bacterium]
MKYIVLFFCFLWSACGGNKSVHPQVEIRTRSGDIVIELYPLKAPHTVAAFLSNVNEGRYTNTSFYRVLNSGNQPSNAPKAELIQGGMWKTHYRSSKLLPSIPHESTRQTGLSHTSGTFSMARQDTGTARSEFFIVISDQPGLDYGGNNNADGMGYAAFGKVIKGMDVVYKIQKQPEYDQTFDPPIAIYEILRK